MAIHLNNVTLTYDRHPAIHHLTATIEQGQWLAIVGPNGAGKSTLLNAIAGLKPITDGAIDGVPPDQVAYLPQQSQLDRDFPITVHQLVATGLWKPLGFLKSLTKKYRNQISAAIAAVGLEGFEKRLINTLSGGQLQRSLFARVLLQDQPFILLDEPFNAIDAKTLNDLTVLIKQWHNAKRTVIMVTHDLDYVQQHCPHTLLLARQCISFGTSSQVITDANLQRARQLSEAFDERAPWCNKGIA